MNSRTTAVGRQFNRSAAGSYDASSHVQRGMAKRLAASVKQWMKDQALYEINILEIGCGTGALTEILANEWPCASITAIDIAPAMLQAAEQRIYLRATNDCNCGKGHSSRIRFLLGDVEQWAADAPASSFDLIISNACFQWLSDPGQTLKHLGQLLRTGGLLAFATFGTDTFHELHSSFHEAYRAIGMEPRRHGLSFCSAEQWEGLLREAGFSNIRCERLCCEVEYPSVRDFLQAVKAQGASTSEAPSSGLRVSRHLFDTMYRAYESKFKTPSGVRCTYDLLFIVSET